MIALRTWILLCLMVLANAAWAQTPAPNRTAPAAKAPANAAASAPASTASASIGTVDLLNGTVTITPLKGAPRNITPGMALEVGDTIKTDDDSEVHATMVDGAFLAVRANSTLKIAEYAANGNSRDRSWINLITGSLRTVTGWVAKTRPKAYRITTPTATIGVRGTDHEVVYLSDEDAPTPEEAGTHNVVFEGATTLETPKGLVNIGVGQGAFVTSKAIIPQLYGKELPVFLVRARGQFDNDVVQHRNNLDSIMQRGLIDKGLMREGQNLQDIFKNIGGDGFIPGAGGAGAGLTRQQNQQRQVQGVQNEILKNVFSGPGNVNEPLPVPFGIPGASGSSGAPSMGLPSLPSGGGRSGGGGMPSMPSLPSR